MNDYQDIEPQSSNIYQSIELKILDPRLGAEFPLPGPATIGSAGFDLRAMIDEEYMLYPHETHLFKSGFAVHIDSSICMLILSRSGLGVNSGINIAQKVGLLDQDFQGQVMIPLRNSSDNRFIVKPGDRIAQAVFVPYIVPKFNVVSEFTYETTRGSGGFGSTGSI